MNLVLVVGERPAQAQALAERLGILGVESIPCDRDLRLAVRCLTSHSISLVLLDVDQQRESAEFFELLRDLTEVPIVARGSTANRDVVLWYLDNGAAAYTGRTVALELLVANLHSLLRAVNPTRQAQGFIRVGTLSIDLDKYVVTKAAEPLSLTPIEFRLLRALAEKAGSACSRDELLERVWGEEFKDCAHYLRVYMGYLRNKIEDDPRHPELIKTVWGYGYRLTEPAQPTFVGTGVRFPVSG